MASRKDVKVWIFMVSMLLLESCHSLRLPVEEADNAQVHERPSVRYHDEDWERLLAENYPDTPLGSSLQAGLEPETPAHGDEDVFSGRLEVVENWPVRGVEIGHVGGVATDPEGYVYVFHRDSRQWTERSFDEKNVYAEQSEGAIKESTLVKMNSTNGVILNKSGANMFYLPHGLTIDSKGNKWMTDVALHQVFKFEGEKGEPSLVLGKKFEPAQNHNDTERFCKPTDVAVASNGDFFVADGYCASRILKFDKDGKFLVQFGVNDFDVAHSLALAEDLDLICGADREGMRVLCYNAGLKEAARTGEPVREYTDEGLGRVYSIAYSQTDGLLYGVTGLTGILIPQGFTIEMRDDEGYSSDFIAAWSPQDLGFESPHAVAVSPDGESIFVGEISAKTPLWKFVKEPLAN